MDDFSSPSMGRESEGLVDQKVTSTGKEKKVPVVEMFGPTIEGEGSLIGTQTMFIRFGLCDFKCKKCDSMHAVDPALVKVLAAWKTPREIAADMIDFMASKNASHVRHVTFSGGNPAIHDLTDLVEVLRTEHGKKILVETQGTKAPDWLKKVNHIVVSPKSPGMGEEFDPKVFMQFMRKYLEVGVLMSVKIVVFSAQDLEFAAAVAELCGDLQRDGYRFYLDKDFYLSLGNDLPPVFEIDAESRQVVDTREVDQFFVNELLARYDAMAEELHKDHRLGFAKLLPQLHVLAWGNQTGR